DQLRGRRSFKITPVSEGTPLLSGGDGAGGRRESGGFERRPCGSRPALSESVPARISGRYLLSRQVPPVSPPVPAGRAGMRGARRLWRRGPELYRSDTDGGRPDPAGR